MAPVFVLTSEADPPMGPLTKVKRCEEFETLNAAWKNSPVKGREHE